MQQYNAADEESIKRDDKLKKRIKDRSDNDIRILCGMPEFRRFIAWYLNRCDEISAVPSGSYTYYNDGARSVCLKIKMAIKEVDRSFLPKIEEEGIKHQKGDF